ncbi:hypothetical protein MP228_010079 [Amoeboaphelidium protococcarum]|nr:hypothetical protein MP228_010079 [Amoeboaphelidium protococcarum]
MSQLTRPRAASFEGLSTSVYGLNADQALAGDDNDNSNHEFVRNSATRNTFAGGSRAELRNMTSQSRQLAVSGDLVPQFQKQSSALSDTSSMYNGLSQGQSMPHLGQQRVEYASEKRNAELHALFRSIPAEDPLIEDYSCALQREILIHGRLYLTKNHLAFNSNIFGFVTNLVISYADILTVERKVTALVIPNAIGITTLHSRFAFASFLYREHVFQLIMKLWRSALGDDVEGLPWSSFSFDDSLSAAASGRKLSNASTNAVSQLSPEDKQQKQQGVEDLFSDDVVIVKQEMSQSMTEQSQPLQSESIAIPTARKPSGGGFVSDGYDRDGYESGTSSPSKSPPKRNLTLPLKNIVRGITSPEIISQPLSLRRRKDDVKFLKPADRKLSTSSGSSAQILEESGGAISANEKKSQPAVFCNCTDHCRIIIMDRIFPASLDQTYQAAYESKEFYKQVMNARQFQDVQIADWSSQERTITYHVPVNYAVMTRNNRCIATQQVVKVLKDKYICIRESIKSPDIPFSSGSAFIVKSSQCLMAVSSNETRILVAYQVEWLKPNLLKSFIEKNAHEGNIAFWREFESRLFQKLSGIDVKSPTSSNAQQSLDQVETKVIPLQSQSIVSSVVDFIVSLPQQLFTDEIVSLKTIVLMAVLLLALLINLYMMRQLQFTKEQLSQFASLDPDVMPSNMPRTSELPNDYVPLSSLPKFWFAYDLKVLQDYADGSDNDNSATNDGFEVATVTDEEIEELKNQIKEIDSVIEQISKQIIAESAELTEVENGIEQ